MGPQRMYGLTPWVRRLLVANLLVFLIQSTLLTSPSFAGAFGFSPAHAWQYPWTFLTYMFLHAGIPHILFNMLMLFVFGSSVEDRMGGRVFVLFYLRSEEHTSELQSPCNLVCRLLLEKKKTLATQRALPWHYGYPSELRICP